jgi:hypothetical protein
MPAPEENPVSENVPPPPPEPSSDGSAEIVIPDS